MIPIGGPTPLDFLVNLREQKIVKNVSDRLTFFENYKFAPVSVDQLPSAVDEVKPLVDVIQNRLWTKLFAAVDVELKLLWFWCVPDVDGSM